MLKNQFFSIQN